jgi:hypothetical protein
MTGVRNEIFNLAPHFQSPILKSETSLAIETGASHFNLLYFHALTITFQSARIEGVFSGCWLIMEFFFQIQC